MKTKEKKRQNQFHTFNKRKIDESIDKALIGLLHSRGVRGVKAWTPLMSRRVFGTTMKPYQKAHIRQHLELKTKQAIKSYIHSKTRQPMIDWKGWCTVVFFSMCYGSLEQHFEITVVCVNYSD